MICLPLHILHDVSKELRPVTKAIMKTTNCQLLHDLDRLDFSNVQTLSREDFTASTKTPKDPFSIKSSSVERELQNRPKLKVINLTGIRLVPKFSSRILRTDYHQLAFLDLSGHSLTDRDLVEISNKCGSKLESFGISDCWSISDVAFIQWINRMKKLQSLAINKTSLTGINFNLLPASLRSLSFTGSKTSKKIFKRIAASAAKSSLQTLGVTLDAEKTRFAANSIPRLGLLNNLRNLRLEIYKARTNFGFLGPLEKLENFYLTACNLSLNNQNLDMLIQTVNPELKTLRLNFKSFSCLYSVQFNGNLFNSLRRLTCLKNLAIDNLSWTQKYSFDGPNVLNTLETLSLVNNAGVSDQIDKLLVGNLNLRKCNLHGSYTSERVLMAFVNGPVMSNPQMSHHLNGALNGLEDRCKQLMAQHSNLKITRDADQVYAGDSFF